MKKETLAKELAKNLEDGLSIFLDAKKTKAYVVKYNFEQKSIWKTIEVRNADIGYGGITFSAVVILLVNKIVEKYEKRYGNEFTIFWNTEAIPTDIVDKTWIYQPAISISLTEKE